MTGQEKNDLLIQVTAY